MKKISVNVALIAWTSLLASRPRIATRRFETGFKTRLSSLSSSGHTLHQSRVLRRAWYDFDRFKSRRTAHSKKGFTSPAPAHPPGSDTFSRCKPYLRFDDVLSLATQRLSPCRCSTLACTPASPTVLSFSCSNTPLVHPAIMPIIPSPVHPIDATWMQPFRSRSLLKLA
ncbi:hypothetical protein OF83DRAFT_655958 [Amylostereum chailletii]|nr:hypothetical protein OF83DRAFT_655958 [Amylostereum chailletii]